MNLSPDRDLLSDPDNNHSIDLDVVLSSDESDVDIDVHTHASIYGDDDEESVGASRKGNIYHGFSLKSFVLKAFALLSLLAMRAVKFALNLVDISFDVALVVRSLAILGVYDEPYTDVINHMTQDMTGLGVFFHYTQYAFAQVLHVVDFFALPAVRVVFGSCNGSVGWLELLSACLLLWYVFYVLEHDLVLKTSLTMRSQRPGKPRQHRWFRSIRHPLLLWVCGHLFDIYQYLATFCVLKTLQISVIFISARLFNLFKLIALDDTHFCSISDFVFAVFLWTSFVCVFAWLIVLLYLPLVFGSRDPNEWKLSTMFDQRAAGDVPYVSGCWGDNTEWVHGRWCVPRGILNTLWVYAGFLRDIYYSNNRLLTIYFYIKVLLSVFLRNMRRILLITFSVWTRATIDKYRVIYRAIRVQAEAEESHSDSEDGEGEGATATLIPRSYQEEVMWITGRSHGMFWALIPGGVILGRLTDYLNENVIFVQYPVETHDPTSINTEDPALHKDSLTQVGGHSMQVCLWVCSLVKACVLAAFVLSPHLYYLYVFVIVLMPRHLLQLYAEYDATAQSIAASASSGGGEPKYSSISPA